MAKTVERRTITYHPGTDCEFSIEFTPGNHRYKMTPPPKEGEVATAEYTPSVTGILDILSIDALPWHGQKIGVIGTQALHVAGIIDAHTPWKVVVQALIEHGKTVNHELRRAAARGDVPHAMLNEYAISGAIPRLADAEPEHRGFVQAEAAFLVDFQPEFIDSELLVASPTHSYCGTLDGRVVTYEPRDLVVDWWFDDGNLREVRDTFPPGLRMIDLKTGEQDHDEPGKGIYAKHHFQLAGYEGAAIECGKSPTDEQLIVHLHKSGRYKVARCVAVPEQFYPLIPAYHVNRAIEKANKAAGKALAT